VLTILEVNENFCKSYIGLCFARANKNSLAMKNVFPFRALFWLWIFQSFICKLTRLFMRAGFLWILTDMLHG